MSKPLFHSTETLTADEASAYLAACRGDELDAAQVLAVDRNHVEGEGDPDDIDVHHALFLIRRALGEDAPSFDAMRVELRKREHFRLGEAA